MFAKVIVDIASSSVDKVFDYLCPFDVQIGNEVLVPFGNRKMSGIVIELSNTTNVAENKLRSIEKLLDGGITPEAVKLSLFMQKKYFL